MTQIRSHRRHLAAWLIAMATVLGWGLARGGAAEIVLRSQVTLKGPVVRLGDVADLSAGTDSRLQELIATPLMPAPAPGTRKYLRVAQLRDLLVARGISLKGITFHGAPRVAIRISPSRLPRGTSPAGMATEKTTSRETGGTYRAGSRQTSRKRTEKGRPGPEKPTEPEQTVVVMAQPVERGMLVRKSDVELRSQKGRVPFRALRSLEQAVGMVARQSLRAGMLLQENFLQKPRLVERGETVTVFARTGGIQVRTYAVAKQDGGLGDLIQVETVDRRERYMARVTGLRELDVFATGALASEHATLHPDKRRFR